MNPKAQCIICNRNQNVSKTLPICRSCILEKFELCKEKILESHNKTREIFGLSPIELLDVSTESSISCQICARKCKLQEGTTGFCGIRFRISDTIQGPSKDYAFVSWYLDPLPTNCVADWICPGGTGCGYPNFAMRKGPEYGYFNLAVFFEACNLNCLYCQNWHFREPRRRKILRHLDQILQAMTSQVTCICFFGGDPSPQAPFAINLSEQALEKRKGKILRICWETNGLFNKPFLDKVIEISLKSGGIIKFDIKAWHEELYIALTGGSKKKVFENFQYVAQFFNERKEIPLLTASTLLVPFYVEEEEVYQIAKFIAEINPEIPYRILAYSPQFFLRDLPLITREKAYRALELAKKVGLKRVSLGNEHLLR